jgi:hypothetical protein
MEGDRTYRGWGAGVCDRGRGGGLRENTLEQVGTISYEGNLLGMNCLLHSFDSRQDVSACARYSGAPLIRGSKNL